MKICILGNSLTSLTLAQNLVNLGIRVDVFSQLKKKDKNHNRTLAISKSNIDFFNNHILNIDKLLWDIKKIEIFSENLNNEAILNFKNDKDQLFSILKNNDLYKLLYSKLQKHTFCKFKKNIINKKIIEKNYQLVINCDANNPITKKFFYKKIIKNYKSYAHTCIIHHKKISENDKAIQIFTKFGPLAFLPISNSTTSIVFSVRGDKNINFRNLIQKYNKFYSIKKFGEILNFRLVSSNLRNYVYKNYLAFGDLLHRIHPLAGQGFNMTVRDIQLLHSLIKKRVDLGLPLDISTALEFEKKAKAKNFVFSNGIDFIYQFFFFESKINNSLISKNISMLGKNKIVNNLFKNFANDGFIY